jgi:stearoyl-CoA desaturase (delta-9 desaturase)
MPEANVVNVLSSPRTVHPDAAAVPGPKPLIEQLAMGFGVVVPFLGLIAAVYLMWGHGVDWTQLALLVGFYSFTILGITIGYHRMFTHRALESGPVLRGLLAIAGSMSAQGPVLEWCAMHRAHHKHSDRQGDPHSPHIHGEGFLGLLKGMWYSHMGWLFASDPDLEPANVADLVADPVLRFVDRFFWVWMLVGWLVPGILAGLILHSWTGVLEGVIWGGLVRTFLLHHVTWSINSVCHVWGTRRFNGPDESRNNLVFGLLAFGEGWHNNHHAFPTSARHGLRWWEFDSGWLVVRLLQKAKLVWNVRVPPPSAIEMRTAAPLASD